MHRGRFPMVILSHGAGGNAGQFGWITAALADAGFVAVLPNRPGTTTGNVSAVLGEITGNPTEYPFIDIDIDRIGILGFSAGG